MTSAASIIHAARARAYAPRKRLTVSEWADSERRLSKKGSAEPGAWRTDRNPPLREPMDCLSATSPVHDVVLCFPIQTGKTEVAVNALGYIMDHNPGPVMVCLPGEVSQKKWINQKLNPMIEETPAVQRALTSINSRDSSNTKEFKDFLGGQLYIEHAGSPARLKSTTAKYLIVDELTEFAANLQTGDDPLMMLEDRTSAFPSTYKRLYISSPGIKGVCRTDDLYEKSDKRRYHVPCPHCDEMQPLEWSGLHWNADGSHVRYVCRECACEIEEHHKTDMIKRGRWIPENPEAKIRGYTINCLYYQIGLGPRWATLVEMWREAQNDPAKLKTFINSRLAEAWEDPAMKKVQINAIQDRAEAYRLRTAPAGVCAVTAGVDTQDNRLAVHITGWGKHMAAWTLDYIELMGDPADDDVWIALTDLLSRPIEHVNGHLLPILATAIDAGGHRTEAVKDFVRKKKIRRPLCIFGAVPNNAPVLSKGKPQDVNYRGHYDKRGVMIHHVGTVGIKHKLFGRMATDGDKQHEARLLHFSEDLPPEYFAGIVSETFNPRTNRFDKKRGARNEPLDCFDSETDVLTLDGWKRFADVTEKDRLATVNLDSDLIEYQFPTALIKRHYTGEMVHLSGSRIDIMVTPNHRMVTLKAKQETLSPGVRKWNFNVKPEIILAKDLTLHHAIKLNATWQGEHIDFVTIPASVSSKGYVIQKAVNVGANDMAALLGWWISEGSISEIVSKTQGNTRRIVTIAQTKPKQREVIKSLLCRLPWKWREEKIGFVCSSMQLYDYLAQFGKYQHDRVVPAWIKESTTEIIACFVTAMIAGDGWNQQKKAHHRTSRTYATTSRILAGDMQELFIKLGNAATMRVVEPKGWKIEDRSGTKVKTQYHVYERLASRAYLDGGGNGKREFIGRNIDYDGMVYCASVPNGTLIVRRSGKTFIAGNCLVYSYAAAHHPEVRLHLYTNQKWDDLLTKYSHPLNAVERREQAAAMAANPQANPSKPSKLFIPE